LWIPGSLCGLVGLWFACQSASKIPGEEIGTFSFTATPVSIGCLFQAVPDSGFTFEATLSHEVDSSKAYLRVGNVERAAGFDGQIFVSEHTAPRTFQECNCRGGSTTVIDETLRVAVLSRSQDEALKAACPDNVLDGGIPAPSPDSGILPPGPRGGSFDAVAACGDLLDVVVVPDGGCDCSGCSMLFSVRGQRK
jgi:hypothetical protein